jgi:SAM-dependent methyltransferase
VVERRQLGEGRRGLLGGLLSLREFYEAGYTQSDAAEAERLGRWRELGARSKAAHVRALCARAGLKPRSLVEIGCGDGALLAQLRGFAAVMDGFELSAPAAELARRAVPEARRIEAYDGDLVPAEDASYDLAILSHVLEHVPDPLPLLTEAARIAGHVLVEVPLEHNRSARRPAKRKLAEAAGHLHAYSRTSLHAQLRTAGLAPRHDLSDPLPYEHHAFFSTPVKAAVKHTVRATAHRLAPRAAERLFTVHYAVLASVEQPLGARH